MRANLTNPKVSKAFEPRRKIAAALLIAVPVILSASMCFGEPPKPARTVPPMDPGLLTGPEMAQSRIEKARKDEEYAELKREQSRIEGELEKAKADGKPIAQLEADLKTVKARGQTLYRPPPWDTASMVWPVLQGKLAELQQMPSGDKPMSLEDAGHLVDMLYTNIDPKLNSNLQLATLNHIKQCAEDIGLPDEVRSFLRNSTLDYYHATRDLCDTDNKGAMCNPWSMLFLSRAIATITTSDDAEALEAFNHLRAAAIEKCASLQWEQERGMFPALYAIAEDGFTLKDEDVRGVKDITDAGLGEEDIEKILRSYLRVLRGPPRRVKPNVVETIDGNLLRLAVRDLSRKNWKLWADVTMTLGPQRASLVLREFVLKSANLSKHEPGFEEMKKVRQHYSKFSPTH